MDTRNPGPKGKGSDVRGELLKAGFALYPEHGLEGFSLREVAERAGVNQAMVRYYFSDKHGFEAAMLDEGYDRVLAAIPDEGDFKVVLAAFTRSLCTMPWLPLLMLRTVLAGDTLRDQFLEKHAPRLLKALGNRIQFGRDLDPTYALLSVISQLVFPHLARPVVGPVLGIAFDEAFANGYADHIAALLNVDQ